MTRTLSRRLPFVPVSALILTLLPAFTLGPAFAQTNTDSFPIRFAVTDTNVKGSVLVIDNFTKVARRVRDVHSVRNPPRNRTPDAPT